MENQFAGVRGGDPSRAPAPTTVVFPCLHCDAPVETVTKRPKMIVPTTCSDTCAKSYIQYQAQQIVIEILGASPIGGTIPQNNARELINAQLTNSQASKGLLRSVPIVCLQCDHATHVFVPKNSPTAKAPKHCSLECRDANKSLAKNGRACRTPNKVCYATEEEAIEAVTSFNITLAQQGDTRGISHYLCDCNYWHAGHMDKHAWFLAAKQALAILHENTIESIRGIS